MNTRATRLAALLAALALSAGACTKYPTVSASASAPAKPDIIVSADPTLPAGVPSPGMAEGTRGDECKSTYIPAGSGLSLEHKGGVALVVGHIRITCKTPPLVHKAVVALYQMGTTQYQSIPVAKNPTDARIPAPTVDYTISTICHPKVTYFLVNVIIGVSSGNVPFFTSGSGTPKTFLVGQC